MDDLDVVQLLNVFLLEFTYFIPLDKQSVLCLETLQNQSGKISNYTRFEHLLLAG